MAKKSATGPQGERPASPSVNSWSFLVLSISLVLAGGVAGSGLINLKNWRSNAARSSTTNSDTDSPTPRDVPAWGELMTTDIWMERPEEYVAFEMSTNQPAEWFFDGRTPPGRACVDAGQRLECRAGGSRADNYEQRRHPCPARR